jgi:hypothetical protein
VGVVSGGFVGEQDETVAEQIERGVDVLAIEPKVYVLEIRIQLLGYRRLVGA